MKENIKNFIINNPQTIKYFLHNFCVDTICNRCGSHVYLSKQKGYSYQCYKCDEDLYRIEISTILSNNISDESLLEDLMRVKEYNGFDKEIIGRIN